MTRKYVNGRQFEIENRLTTVENKTDELGLSIGSVRDQLTAIAKQVQNLSRQGLFLTCLVLLRECGVPLKDVVSFLRQIFFAVL